MSPGAARQPSGGPLAALIAAEEIRRLKARYFRFLDTKAWAQLDALFARECRIDVEGRYQFDQPASFVGFISKAFTDVVSVHHGHMPEIEVDGDHARGIWAMEDVVTSAEPDGLNFHGYGHYHETYRREPDGRWVIVEMRLTRLRRDKV